jgi:hypothetical protein
MRFSSPSRSSVFCGSSIALCGRRLPTYYLELVLRDIDPLARHSIEVAVAIDADALKDGIHKDRVRM